MKRKVAKIILLACVAVLLALPAGAEDTAYVLGGKLYVDAEVRYSVRVEDCSRDLSDYYPEWNPRTPCGEQSTAPYLDAKDYSSFCHFKVIEIKDDGDSCVVLNFRCHGPTSAGKYRLQISMPIGEPFPAGAIDVGADCDFDTFFLDNYTTGVDYIPEGRTVNVAVTEQLDECTSVTSPEKTWFEMHVDIPCLRDSDGDGICNVDDNCDLDPNPGQENNDGDRYGNVCDNCPDVYNNYQEDADGDGIGDSCDTCTDTDIDGYGNPGFPENTCQTDNCPDDYNPTQANSDPDPLGDACDPCVDSDDDGFGNPGFGNTSCPDDNCPYAYNPGQEEYPDGDSHADSCDNCPLIANEDQADFDCDGVGDVCDVCPLVPDPSNDPAACVCDPASAYEWQYSLGCGQMNDHVTDVAELSDGSLIFVGYIGTAALAGEPLFASLYSDSLLIIKTNACGQTQWRKTMAGTSASLYKGMTGISVSAYPSAGFIVAGRRAVQDHGHLFLAKFDNEGTMEWQAPDNFPINEQTFCWDAIRTSDNSYIMVGQAYDTWDTDMSDSYGLICKTDLSGNYLWHRIFNTDSAAAFYDVLETAEGDFLLAGYKKAFNQRLYSFIKTDADGVALWANTVIGDPKDQFTTAYSVDTVAGGGYCIAGDYLKNPTRPIVLKLTADGYEDWRYYGCSGYPDNNNSGRAVRSTDDGGVVLAGFAECEQSGNFDAFAVRLTSDGDPVWTRMLGDNADQQIFGMEILADGGPVLAGITGSIYWSNYHAYLVKIGGPDGDGDGIGDVIDNCPEIANPDQADLDDDGVGNVCDNCIEVANPGQENSDADTLGNACDNCPDATNDDQADSDGDGEGDVCDYDTCCEIRGDADHDGSLNAADVLFLVDWLWKGGEWPTCKREADANATGEPNAADLIYLVDYFWKGGPPPPPCDLE